MMTDSRCSEDMQRSIDYKNKPGRAGTEYREVCVTQARHMEEKWAKHSSGQSTCPRKPLIYPYVYMNHDLELLLKQHANSLVLCCPVAWLHLARDCWYGRNRLQAEVIRLSWSAIWIRHFNDLKELERHKFEEQIIFWLIISCVCRESQCVQDLMPSQM